jgi:hypothetical protein
VTRSSKHSYVCISGYGWTGSSACIDLLKEFDGFCAPSGEFRILKDPYGLVDLENLLVHDWEFIRHDTAIRDFLKYCEVLSRGTGLFSKTGKDFSSKLNINFMKESQSYIDKLTDMTYFGDTFVHRYNIPAYKNFFMKARSKFGKNNAKSMYLARPSEDFFIKETRKYIDNLFIQYAHDKNVKKVILDQAIPPTNILKTKRYFNNIKIIIIDRDPRDIYVNMHRGKGLLGPDLINMDSSEKYITWHNMLREKSLCDNLKESVLRLYFEDLIFKYDESIDKITNFLDIDSCHSQKGKYFKPSDSIKNVGLWKEYKNQIVMSEIYDKLKSDCYKF